MRINSEAGKIIIKRRKRLSSDKFFFFKKREDSESLRHQKNKTCLVALIGSGEQSGSMS